MLTPAEELTLGKQVQEMMSHEEDRRDYNAKRNDPLTVEQFTAQFRAGREKEVKRAYRLGTRAKNRMVSANLRLVVSIAKKYSKRNLELLDIIQEGTLGLVRGVEKFDPTRGYKFSTYAYWWVRQGITRAIGEKSRMVRLPVNVVDTLNQVRKTQQKLSQELMRTATLQEVCNELELCHEAVRDLMHRSQEPCSLEVRIGDAQDSRLVEMLVDDSEDPEQLLSNNTMGEDINEAFSNLTDQEQSILCLHYGFVAGEQDDPRSMSWISNKLNLSRDKVRMIEKKALIKLRGEDLKGYLENVS
jgi:RNA polymerase nonessential primary-like sigma factor